MPYVISTPVEYSNKESASTNTNPLIHITFPHPTNLFPNPVTNQSINFMITCRKTPQLHLLTVLYLFRIAISPLQRHLAIRIRIHENIKRAVAFQLREEGYACRNLAEDGLDLRLDFNFGFFDCGGRSRPTVQLVRINAIKVQEKGKWKMKHAMGRTQEQHSPYQRPSLPPFLKTLC